jgi:hypothetical protein
LASRRLAFEHGVEVPAIGETGQGIVARFILESIRDTSEPRQAPLNRLEKILVVHHADHSFALDDQEHTLTTRRRQPNRFSHRATRLEMLRRSVQQLVDGKVRRGRVDRQNMLHLVTNQQPHDVAEDSLRSLIPNDDGVFYTRSAHASHRDLCWRGPPNLQWHCPHECRNARPMCVLTF